MPPPFYADNFIAYSSSSSSSEGTPKFGLSAAFCLVNAAREGFREEFAKFSLNFEWLWRIFHRVGEDATCILRRRPPRRLLLWGIQRKGEGRKITRHRFASELRRRVFRNDGLLVRPAPSHFANSRPRSLAPPRRRGEWRE